MQNIVLQLYSVTVVEKREVQEAQLRSGFRRLLAYDRTVQESDDSTEEAVGNAFRLMYPLCDEMGVKMELLGFNWSLIMLVPFLRQHEL